MWAVDKLRPVKRCRMIPHSDRSSQFASIRYSEQLAEARIEQSAESVGDSCENDLAETIKGLYKAKAIHSWEPWRNFEAVEC